MKQWVSVSSSILASVVLFFFIVFVSFFCLIFLSNEISMIFEWELFVVGSIVFSVPVLLDKMSLVFSLAVLIISFSVMLFTSSYMSGDKEMEYFIILVMFFVSSMNILIFFPHLITLLLGWDGLGLTSYLLVIYYSNDKSLGAGMITALTNRIGDALLILACSWSLMAGHFSFSFLSWGFSGVAFLSVFIASMTKSAQLPFSAWLPAAMAAPTPVSALVHSSTLVTAGVYLLIRFYSSLSLFYCFHSFCFYIGALTCFMASLAAIYENDLKKVIALSTLSQLGVMVVCLGVGQPSLTFFHLVTHALFKALLFICAGTIIHCNASNQDIRLMGSVWYTMPITSASLNIANLSLCGIPFMAGFYSKDSVVEMFLIGGNSLVVSFVFLLSVCLTSAYSMKLSVLTLWSPYKGCSNLSMHDMSAVTWFSYFILLMGAVMGGASFFWLMNPTISFLLLPLFMKLMTLFFIIFFGFFMLISVKNSNKLGGSFYLVSMWFLTLTSSSPLSSQVFNMSKVMFYNEYTWMELMSGKGLGVLMGEFSMITQKMSNMNTSYMLSFFSVLVFFVVLLF